jgi:hypothetical protein
MADRYGWCHTTQCVAEWSWGQNANNLFTLFGAIATFAAAYLALRFSQREAKRRQAEELMRAKLAAIANAHFVADVHKWVEREREKIELAMRVDGLAGAKAALQAVFVVISTQIEPVADDALLLLAAMPGGAAFRISRAFATLGHLREDEFRLKQVYDVESEVRIRAEVRSAIAALESSGTDLSIASAALSDAAKF